MKSAHAIDRSSELRAAQQRAASLFEEIRTKKLIAASASEKQVGGAIYALASERFGVRRYWHKRIVRSGPNTLFPYQEDPPDRTIESDDIVFVDLGPVFEEWEADFGRTFVLGDDPVKHRLQEDIEIAFRRGKAFFESRPDILASTLYRYMVKLAQEMGWEYGGPHAGHLIGEFPHERIEGDKVTLYIHPQNDTRMNAVDAKGNKRHWILEVHFIDRARKIGGFFEELLTVS